MQFMVEGIQARLSGIGTPTALPYIGRDRRIIRGPHETDADYAARLLEWLDLWRAAGNAYALAKALQAFLSPGHPASGSSPAPASGGPSSPPAR